MKHLVLTARLVGIATVSTLAVHECKWTNPSAHRLIELLRGVCYEAQHFLYPGKNRNLNSVKIMGCEPITIWKLM